MLRCVKTITPKILLFTIFVMVPLSVHAMEDTIIAVVNDEIITYRDLLDHAATVYTVMQLENQDPALMDEIMKNLELNGLKRLIEDRLILHKANEVGMEIKESMVDDKMKVLAKNYPSEQEFKDALITNGSTITELRKRIRDHFKTQFMIEMEVKSKVFINPQEVTDFYEQNIHEFRRLERVNLDSIFLPKKENPEENKKKAEEALDLLNSGNDFSKVALEYSKGVPLGIIERNQLLPQVEEKVFSLNPGEISSVIESDTGYFIFKLKERLPAETVPLEEVKDSITQLIFQTKFKEQFEDWLLELREDAFIEIKE